jgi:hypothetical protein
MPHSTRRGANGVALAVGWVLAHTLFSPEVRSAFAAIGRESTGAGFGLTSSRYFAGWLLALLVWLLPFGEHARFFVIIALTLL